MRHLAKRVGEEEEEDKEEEEEFYLATPTWQVGNQQQLVLLTPMVDV